MKTVAEIAEELNAQAESLARELLPNGFRSGNNWMASGIEDNGKGSSLFVTLTGPKAGKWRDMGNARIGEERGDMLDLLRLVLGLADAGAAVAEAKLRLGIADEWTPEARRADPAELERRAAAVRERAAERERLFALEVAAKTRGAKALWLRGVPIAGTPAEYYLQGRELGNGGMGWPSTLVYCPEVWCEEVRCKVPAMLAQVMRANGEQTATHRTYLELDARAGWRKLDVLLPKKVLGPMWGGFIPISKGASGKPMAKMPDDEPVYVTEGIEDALVVRMMRPEARIIAAVSLGNIGAIVLPPAARRLVIVCDRDDNPTAQDQLERSIAQQQARGLDVEIVFPPEDVMGRKVKDLNDWLRALNALERRRVRGGKAA